MTSPTSRTPAPDSAAEAAGRGAHSTPASKPGEVEEWVDERIHRPLARRVVALLVRTPITPNQVTLLSGFVGVLGGIALFGGAEHRAWLVLSGVLLFVSVVLDCCDGQLARAKQISSTTGAILDGLADYAVGVTFGIGASHYLVHRLGSPWYWLLGLVGIVSSAVQSAMFDHAKTRYIARVGGGYCEREEDVDRVARDRSRARAEGRYGDALLFWLYEGYSRAQHASLAIPPAPDPIAYRNANAGRMRTWTTLGIGTHFALGYLACVLSWWWAPALAAYFILCSTLLNLFLAAMMATEGRPVQA
jgi:phosphatidylglycerophosphate synthase